MAAMIPRGTLLAPLLLLVACATPLSENRSSSEIRQQLLSGDALPAHIQAAISQPEDDVLGASDDIIRFVDQVTSEKKTESDKVRALLLALTDGNSRNFVFDPAATYTAAQTFETGRANCLSFSGMLTVMLRYLGIEARLNEVDVPEVWDMQSPKTMLLYKHVNVVIKPRGGRRQIADLDMAGYDDSYRQRTISDQQAIAQYYNNRAMAYLFDDQLAASFSYLAKALELDPHRAFLWANLGTLYRRMGIYRSAELSYQAALSEDPGNLIAISNLARLYDKQGKPVLASKLNRRADYFRSRNPYYRYRQGMEALATRDLAQALGHAKAAIRMYPKEHRFYFLLGVIYQQLGNQKKAAANLQKAVEMSTDAKQKASYRGKMDRLLPAGP